MPTLTPCSAASFTLKNMRLPKMQRSVGLPRALRTAASTSDDKNLSSNTLNIEQDIALEQLGEKLVLPSGLTLTR